MDVARHVQVELLHGDDLRVACVFAGVISVVAARWRDAGLSIASARWRVVNASIAGLMVVHEPRAMPPGGVMLPGTTAQRGGHRRDDYFSRDAWTLS